MPRRLSAALITACAVMVTLLLLPSQGAHADVTIIGDDDRNAFVGSGSLLLPPQISTYGRETAAECPGCVWRSVIQCEMTSAGACRGPARLCGVDGYWLRIYVTRPDGVEIDLGAACFGPGGPVSRESVEGVIRDRIVARVPDLKPWRQPAGRALPHVPVIFGVSEQEVPVTDAFEVLGLSITLTARPRWVWDFGSESVATLSPGRRWPHPTITHTYRQTGDAVVNVTAVWEATYEVGGVGPLDVAEPVVQRDATTVRVGQGRAILVR